MAWFKLSDDMPTDPKWGVIATRSGRPVSDVVAMFIVLAIQAAANKTTRGVARGGDDEEIGAMLGIDPDAVSAIRAAMQGKVLDGDELIGWEKIAPRRAAGNGIRHG